MKSNNYLISLRFNVGSASSTPHMEHKEEDFSNFYQNMQKIIIKIVTFINSLGLFTILLIQILDEKVIFIKKG